jgi:hypothetical protein
MRLQHGRNRLHRPVVPGEKFPREWGSHGRKHRMHDGAALAPLLSLLSPIRRTATLCHEFRIEPITARRLTYFRLEAHKSVLINVELPLSRERPPVTIPHGRLCGGHFGLVRVKRIRCEFLTHTSR